MMVGPSNRLVVFNAGGLSLRATKIHSSSKRRAFSAVSTSPAVSRDIGLSLVRTICWRSPPAARCLSTASSLRASLTPTPNRLPPDTTHSAASASRPPRRQLLTSALLLSAGLFSGIALVIFFPRPSILNVIYPTPTSHPPPKESREGIEYTNGLEQELQSLELVNELRSLKSAAKPVVSLAGSGSSTLTTAAAALKDGDSEVATELVPTYTESRPYAATPAGPHSLSGYTLKGPGKFAIPPLVFTTRDKKEAIFFLHLGNGLCGHEGIVHGGLLATVLDEALARQALLNLPTNIGVTATLSLKYKKPTFANQFVVIRTHFKESKGRKVWVEGRLEDLNGQLLVEAEALFVEPKMARFLDNSSVRDALK